MGQGIRKCWRSWWGCSKKGAWSQDEEREPACEGKASQEEEPASVKALRQECRGMHLGNSPVFLDRVSKGKAEGGKEGQCRAADHEKVSASEDHKCQWRVRSRAGT